jgi:hypothetical protein
VAVTLRLELFGGPKDGETVTVDHVVASLTFPALANAQPENQGDPRVHRYEWRATAQPSGYYYAGIGRL